MSCKLAAIDLHQSHGQLLWLNDRKDETGVPSVTGGAEKDPITRSR